MAAKEHKEHKSNRLQQPEVGDRFTWRVRERMLGNSSCSAIYALFCGSTALLMETNGHPNLAQTSMPENPD